MNLQATTVSILILLSGFNTLSVPASAWGVGAHRGTINADAAKQDSWSGSGFGDSFTLDGKTKTVTYKPGSDTANTLKPPKTRTSDSNAQISNQTVSDDSSEIDYSWRHLCADNATGDVSIACAIAAPDVCPPGEYLGVILAIDSSGVTTETGQRQCTGSTPTAPAPVAAGGAPAPAAPPVVITVTASDFQQLPIPPSTINLDTQGNTLRTAHTNIYATASVRNLNTTVLGQPVRVRAVPIEYIWNYGDGTTRRTYESGEAVAGDPFDIQTETSHQFEGTGTFPINLTTVYTGQFSVNGGPWISINGVARVDSAPESMTVWKTKRSLVAEDCIANPGAIGCNEG